MGFDPMSIDYLRWSTERGLGEARIENIEIVGEDIGRLNFEFSVKKSFVIWGDQMLRKGPLRFLEKLALPQAKDALLHALAHDPARYNRGLAARALAHLFRRPYLVGGLGMVEFTNHRHLDIVFQREVVMSKPKPWAILAVASFRSSS